MDLLGLRGFRGFVLQLPRTPKEAILKLLSQLEIPKPYWRHFLLCELFSIAGWASFVKYRVREAEFAGNCDEDLLGLLAIRLAYDVALAQSPGIPWPLALWPADVQIADGTAMPPTPSTDAVARYTLQVATERAYRRQLCGKLAKDSKPRQSTLRKTLQMVCCIDVRSEVLRRHLESVDESIETFGFAGFFGMALEYVSFGASSGPSQCPVLLTPNFRVRESLLGASEQEQSQASQRRQTVRTARKLWKSFQTSAASCFSYVETLGLSFVAKLLTDSLRLTRPVPTAERDGLSSHANRHLGPDIHSPHNSGLPPHRQIDLAEGMLRNLGLTDGFGRIVLLCGHAADVTNNPYKAGLDCGACGGHSGEPNARVAAALLNDPEVRRGLLNLGIIIPHDTWFAAAVHNTTTDAVRLCDPQLAPLSHAADLQRVERWLSEAGLQTRIERCRRLGTTEVDDLLRRSADWSEVRPEWGLAGNAAFIVAPRSRTKGLDLGGRTFMHSYESSRDPELKVLELIMTAPMVVTNWINMQYYASAVDPRAFGSGNKVIHNVVGQFGVLQGNGGDLMTGLPMQSVHDGRQLQHEPLRLLVIIEAPRDAVALIIAKHALVRNLVTNGWLHLMAWDQDQFYRWTSQETWEEEQFS